MVGAHRTLVSQRAPARRADDGDAIKSAPAATNDAAALHYTAIVESSEDAILSKDLTGVILSWNQGAERLFGYTAQEAIGKPITMIIPLDRQGEEPQILERIRKGERIQNFETVRQRKDGSFVDVSLTVSPIRDSSGKIVGVSKISRDITEIKRHRDRQQLLLREMSHRVKNLFALASSIVGLSARSATSVRDLADSARERIAALARAHALTFSHGLEAPAAKPTSLRSLIETIVAPFDDPRHAHVTVAGADVPVSGSAVASLALLVHEFATNATKYGALSKPEGTVEIVCAEEGEMIVLNWTERGGPPVTKPEGVEGFGGVLSRIAVTSQLGGEIARNWKPEGLSIRLSAPRARLSA